jgi:hypothetical protein
MEEKCASAAICFVSFLPDILDSKADGRNKYLELLSSVAEKFKKSPYRCIIHSNICSDSNYLSQHFFSFF